METVNLGRAADPPAWASREPRRKKPESRAAGEPCQLKHPALPSHEGQKNSGVRHVMPAHASSGVATDNLDSRFRGNDLGSPSLPKNFSRNCKRQEVISVQFFSHLPTWRERGGVSRFSPLQTPCLARFDQPDFLASKQIKSECQPVRLYSYCLAHAAP